MEFLSEERRRAIGWDEPFEDRWWRVEKIAWMLMTALLVAGGFGLFGRGVLAKSHTTGPNVAVNTSGSCAIKRRPGSPCGCRPTTAARGCLSAARYSSAAGAIVHAAAARE
jgi:hypothetical protein